MLYEIEREVLNELEGFDSKTFLYQLHENSFFNQERYYHFMDQCTALAEHYLKNARTARYSEIVRLMLDRFSYIGLRFTCHYSTFDLSKIVNWSPDIETSIISEFFEKCREITNTIIID